MKRRIISILTWIAVLISGLVFIFCILFEYRNIELIRYENKDITFGTWVSGRSSYLYRSLIVEDKGGVYNDSDNATRPFRLDSFRWTKFPSVHMYFYMDHDKILNSKEIYFYCNKSSRDLFAITGDNLPSKRHLFFSIISWAAKWSLFFGGLFLLLIDFIRKKMGMEGSERNNALFLPLFVVLGLMFIISFI